MKYSKNMRFVLLVICMLVFLISGTMSNSKASSTVSNLVTLDLMANVDKTDKLDKLDNVSHIELASILPQEEDAFEQCGPCATHAQEAYYDKFYSCLRQLLSEETCQIQAHHVQCTYIRTHCNTCKQLKTDSNCL